MNSKLTRSSEKSVFTRKEESAIIEKLMPITRFAENDFKYLLMIFTKYANENQVIEKPDFLEMLHEYFGYTEHFFMNREGKNSSHFHRKKDKIEQQIFIQADTNRDGRIAIDEYIHLLSLLLRGTKEEKIKFCFQCYDLNETMQLSRDIIITLLSQANAEAIETNPDMVLHLLEMALKKMDKDGDGVLIFEEFKNAAIDDWLLMEAFGQCLPDYKRHMTFLEQMEKSNK